MTIRRVWSDAEAARWLLVIGLGIVWLVAACGNDSGPKVTYPNRETPQGVIDTFAKSLRDKDIAKYEECLADAYRYEFDERDYDVAGVTMEQPFWGLTTDVERTDVMFSSEHTDTIGVDLSVVVEDFAGPDTALTFTCEPKIDVTIVGQPGEEPVTKQVRRVLFRFVLRPDQHSNGLWVIQEIKETVKESEALGRASEATTFGSIKSMYR